ncbi:uncharacterized protein LOC112343246 [Selaginella moellendorffii]|uniref:uncharacterized protein LOC112343246 n=1 Tax=Selaginella moellendorffii TaxID=88036 RepID=UPI000D1C8E12|nr:uncharacterized protein LOC112343246 [Selaginella moellendorffii]|eukprot:XP_024522159.1 uncharacterized protein LOC112343246 [Selaginella moellendorffii]
MENCHPLGNAITQRLVSIAGDKEGPRSVGAGLHLRYSSSHCALSLQKRESERHGRRLCHSQPPQSQRRHVDNKECFRPHRCRYKGGGLLLRSILDTDKVIHVHKGGWTYDGSYNTGSVNGEILGSAWQLDKPSSVSRRWSLMNGKAILTVNRDVKDKHWNMKPQLRVEMKSHDCPIMLFSGRHLEFAVPGASERQEAWFVTMVRFTRDAPQGKATALFNWRSGGMQVDRNEDVLLVLLLSATISMSVSDMLGKAIPSWTRTSKRVIVSEEEQDHWGAVTVDRRRRDGGDGGDGGGDVGCGDGCDGDGQCWYDEGGSYCGGGGGGGGGCGISGGGGCGGAGGGGGGGGGIPSEASMSLQQSVVPLLHTSVSADAVCVRHAARTKNARTS